MRDVENKVAFITGGSSGIGLGIARAFVSAGMRVIITYRSKSHLASALSWFRTAEDRIHAIELEVTDRRAMLTAADEAERVFGPVHVLCNNAGIGITVPITEASFDDWDWAIDVNIRGIINGLNVFLPRMRKHGEGGHVLSTASMGGLFLGGNVGIYNTTKFAVVGMMEALRAELAGTEIGVSLICPGLVNSDIHLVERSRPERYARSIPSRTAAERADRAQWFKDNVLSAGMDPLELGRLVLEGVQCNDLYILTHPEYEAGIRERFEAILAAIPRGKAVPDTRQRAEARVLRHPLYAAERDRRSTNTPSRAG